MALILIIGGADTGRAPMAAALLSRLAESRGFDWQVESAGVLGHDGEKAEAEARNAMAVMGLSLDEHIARSLNEELVAAAVLLIAVDSGIVRVLEARYSAAMGRIHTIGGLAGRSRDIPDPFRMQVGAWISYAKEMELLLKAGIGQISSLLYNAPGDAVIAQPPAPMFQVSSARQEAVERCIRLLSLIRDMPSVVDWPNARRQLEAEFGNAAAPLQAGEPVAGYIGMLTRLLGLSDTSPSAPQIATLLGAVERLRSPIGDAEIVALSQALTDWEAA